MRVFVTGVSGYAGFHAALRLAATGHTVTGIVRNPEQPRLNILRMQEVTLLCGDVGKAEIHAPFEHGLSKKGCTSYFHAVEVGGRLERAVAD